MSIFAQINFEYFGKLKKSYSRTCAAALLLGVERWTFDTTRAVHAVAGVPSLARVTHASFVTG